MAILPHPVSRRGGSRGWGLCKRGEQLPHVTHLGAILWDQRLQGLIGSGAGGGGDQHDIPICGVDEVRGVTTGCAAGWDSGSLLLLVCVVLGVCPVGQVEPSNRMLVDHYACIRPHPHPHHTTCTHHTHITRTHHTHTPHAHTTLTHHMHTPHAHTHTSHTHITCTHHTHAHSLSSSVPTHQGQRPQTAPHC